MPDILATAKVVNYFQKAAKGKIFCNMFAHIKKRLYICAILNRLACNEPLFAGGWQGLGSWDFTGRGIYRRLAAATTEERETQGGEKREKEENKGRKAKRRKAEKGSKRRGEKRGFGEWNDEILKKT